jgi:hypothetical protein
LLPISPVAEGDEDECTMQGIPSTVTTFATLVHVSKEKCGWEDPSYAMEEGEQDINERIKQLEKQVLEWKEKAEVLILQCEELEEDKMIQEKEIEALKKRPSPSPRPSVASQRGASRRFSSISNRGNQLQRQSTMGLTLEKQMREEAELEVQALEARLVEIDGEKGDLLRELEAMKTILQNTSDDDSVGKKKVERLVYQLSCKKCNKHPNFIGTTEDDIITTIDGHICRVIDAVKEGKSKSSPSKRKDEVDDIKIENWSDAFAHHFAKHCKSSVFKSVSDQNVKKFCIANVKIKVLRISDGTDLMWEENHAVL